MRGKSICSASITLHTRQQIASSWFLASSSLLFVHTPTRSQLQYTLLIEPTAYRSASMFLM